MGLLSRVASHFARNVGSHVARNGMEYGLIGGLGATALGAGIATTRERMAIERLIASMPDGPDKLELMRILELNGPYDARRAMAQQGGYSASGARGGGGP